MSITLLWVSINCPGPRNDPIRYYPITKTLLPFSHYRRNRRYPIEESEQHPLVKDDNDSVVDTIPTDQQPGYADALSQRHVHEASGTGLGPQPLSPTTVYDAKSLPTGWF